MEITIRHTDGCPNVAKVEQNLREALGSAGKDTQIRHDLVRSVDDAERLGFVGSPTILIDGRDPFAESGLTPALACRLYQTEAGLDGAPSVSQLTTAVSACEQ